MKKQKVKYGKIYIIKNTVNSKLYIGKTIRSLKTRLREHRNSTLQELDNSSLHKAMRKYGIMNFHIEELETVFETYLNYQEIYWIEKLDTLRNGYNDTIRGEGVSNYKHTNITKKKMSENNKNKRKIIQYSKEGELIKEYNSIKEASIELNINYTSISKVCNGRCKSAGNFIFKYSEEVQPLILVSALAAL